MKEEKKISIKEIIISVLVGLQLVSTLATVVWCACLGNAGQAITFIPFIPLCIIPTLILITAILYAILLLVIYTYISVKFRKPIWLDDISEFIELDHRRNE